VGLGIRLGLEMEFGVGLGDGLIIEFALVCDELIIAVTVISGPCRTELG